MNKQSKGVYFIEVMTPSGGIKKKLFFSNF